MCYNNTLYEVGTSYPQALMNTNECYYLIKYNGFGEAQDASYRCHSCFTGCVRWLEEPS